MHQNIQLKLEILRENDLYVGICPALSVSSFGETLLEAKQSVQEALLAFIEECEDMGTLIEVLEESGFILKDGVWMYPQPIAVEIVTL
ncbi:MAG: type II toxin-antitoxin system HicB family antitoxin [Microcystis aeruginosa LL13-06]|jgi:predicted RNase H-like HicB family nuclease|nr:type II toxin-antitoxin system HicB family antitoxin [Microcystis aeruginosa LL13-06]NCS14020.1 type II toxin-antitoxin system HicB family antitoxin [Microcystis aeruginosa G13-09]